MKKNGGAESLLDETATRVTQSESLSSMSAMSLGDKPATVSHSDSAASSATLRSSSKPLRNWKHEEFVRQVVAGTEPADAYVLAGFERHRANHNRLMRKQHVKDRIELLRRDRETAARAARVPISQVIEELDRRGLVRIEDFFERNAAGIVSVRDLQMVPVEVAVAFLRILSEGFGISQK